MLKSAVFIKEENSETLHIMQKTNLLMKFLRNFSEKKKQSKIEKPMKKLEKNYKILIILKSKK